MEELGIVAAAIALVLDTLSFQVFTLAPRLKNTRFDATMQRFVTSPLDGQSPYSYHHPFRNTR